MKGKLIKKVAECLYITFNTHSNSAGLPDMLKLATYNVNGLGESRKRREVLTWVKEKGDDIVLLQETHSTGNSETQWTND